MQLIDGLKLRGRCKLIAMHKDTNQVLKYIRKDNLVVNTGLYMVGDMLIDVVTTGITYCAIGSDNTAPAAGDVLLGAEEARKAFTQRYRTLAVLTFSTFFTAAESTYNIKESGLFGDAATAALDSGTLFSRALTAYDNSAGLANVTLIWSLTIS